MSLPTPNTARLSMAHGKAKRGNTIVGNDNDQPVILLIIDPQIDFHEGGNLAVSKFFLLTLSLPTIFLT